MGELSFEARLRELGIDLPAAPLPVAAYVPAAQAGRLVFTAGQLPLVEGRLLYQGRVGVELAEAQGREAARLCAVNCLAALRSLAGSLDLVERVVKVTGYVACGEGFQGHPAVLNGASELFQAVFGEAGRHARAAVGVASLPLGAPVEVEAIFLVSGE